MTSHSAIFISYRRDDTADAAGRIYDRLTGAFGENSVFKDVDSIPFGSDFADYIVSTLQKCRVTLVLIGPHWLDIRDRNTSARRLDDPGDYVRIEVETALQAQDVQVVPVLVSGASMPLPSELPESLSALCKLNAAQVRRDPDFSKDMNKLIDELKKGALTGNVVVEPVVRTAAEIRWDELKDSVNIEEILLFADSFPGTAQGHEARVRANWLTKAVSEFEDVRQQDEYEAYLLFMDKYSGTPQGDRAAEIIESIEARTTQAFHEACARNAYYAIVEFMKAYPHAAKREEVLEKLKEVEFNEALADALSATQSYRIERFLEAYPDAPQADQLKVRLAELFTQEEQAQKRAKEREQAEQLQRAREADVAAENERKKKRAEAAKATRRAFLSAGAAIGFVGSGFVGAGWFALYSDSPFLRRALPAASLKAGAKFRIEPSVRINHGNWIHSVTFSPDGKFIVSTGKEGSSANVWDSESGALLGQLQGHSAEVYSAAFSGNGDLIITASRDGTARIWDAQTRKTLAVLKDGKGQATSAALSADGQSAATSHFGEGTEFALKVWDVKREAPTHRIMPRTSSARGVKFAPSNNSLLVAVYTNASIWASNAAGDYELVARLVAEGQNIVWSAEYSPDGRRIVTASADKNARIWNAETGREISVLSGHQGEVRHATFSPDGSIVATASWDGTTRIWDASTADQIGILRGHADRLTSVSFSPDGRRLLTASVDGSALFWDLVST